MMKPEIVGWLRKNCKWHKWSPHYERTLMFNRNTDYGRTYVKGMDYYLVNREGEVAKIPYHMMVSLHNGPVQTEQWGPYIFYNWFQNTKEAAYLKQMFRYPVLEPRAKEKVDSIIRNNSLWIELDTTFTEALEERERRIRNG